MNRLVEAASRGLLLIALGVVFFLINFGILPWHFWLLAIDLWPLILILLGGALVLNRRIPFSAVLLFFLLALVGYALVFGDSSGQRSNVERGWPWHDRGAPFLAHSSGMRSLNVLLEQGVDRADLDLKLGGARFNIRSQGGAEEQQQLLTGEYAWQDSVLDIARQPQLQTLRSGDTVRVTFDGQKAWGMRSLDLNLSPLVRYDLAIDAGAIDGRLDLSELQVEHLKLNTGASKFDLIFGDNGTATEAQVNSGASNVTLEVPDSVGLRVHFSGVVSSTNFMGSGLVLANRDWVSPNYDQAKSKVDLTLSAAAGAVELRRPAAGAAH